MLYGIQFPVRGVYVTYLGRGPRRPRSACGRQSAAPPRSMFGGEGLSVYASNTVVSTAARLWSLVVLLVALLIRPRTTEALADPAVRNRFDELGFEIYPREQQTADKLREMVEADAKKWWPIIEELRIKPE
jgi:hypothetical protein